MKSYKVADFFCGGGGFSEGFKLAGFQIVFAVDKWQPAVATHHANHPNAKTYQDDVIRISNLPDDEFHQLVPDTEIIIGSPPCTSFSNSNKSGKADKSLGIQLIEAYLKIIARKKIKKDSILKHWVLENVPNVVSFIKDEYTYKELGINHDGILQVKYPSSKVYNSKNFGVASNRKRYFCGDFPEPEQVIVNEEDARTVNEVLKSLGQPGDDLEKSIEDPNHHGFYMKSKDITDHHYIMEVAEFEWKKAKRMKQDKGYMGRMSFPEDLNKPSRTIMATMSCSSRESMIYPYIPNENRYRVPTVREIGCLMSYPLDYRFYGKSKSLKYMLVGNSVPPLMSFAIAKSIVQAHQLYLPKKYTPIDFENKELEEFVNLNFEKFHVNTEKPKRANALFKYHIPYLIINTYRVELTNYHSNFETLDIKWDAEIHKSQGPRAMIFIPEIENIHFEEQLIKKIDDFISDLSEKLVNCNQFQKIHCMTAQDIKKEDLIGPYELLDLIKKFTEHVLHENDFEIRLKITDNLIDLPKPIALAYRVLKEITKKMKTK